MNLFGTKKAAPPKLSDTIKQLREALVRLATGREDRVHVLNRVV